MRGALCGVLAAMGAMATTSVVSCGGGDADQLFSGTTGGAAGAAGHVGGTGGAAGTNVPDASAGGQQTGGAGGVSQGGQAGNVQGGGGGAPPVEAGPEPVVIRCGPQMPSSPKCTVPPQVCCLSHTTVYAAGKCVAGAAACNDGTLVECSGSVDCPSGDKCCGTIGSVQVNGQWQDRYTKLACQADCAAEQKIVCSVNKPDCPANQKCGESQLLPSGFSVCGQN